MEVTLNDILASLELGTNPKAIGKDNITVTKTEEETTIKVKVTSQNGLETEEYTIAILEQSQNSNLDTITVNGKDVFPSLDGIYRAKLTHDIAALSIKATATDTYAVTQIDGIYNDTYIALKLEAVVDGKTIYTYEIKVTAENGTSSTYTLEVEIQEANYNITEIKAGETKENLEATILQDDGKYHYKIGRVEEAFVKVELESTKSTSKINGELGDLVKVRLEGDITEVPITVIGEDGTEKEYILVIEKKSNDTSILSVSGNDVLDVKMEGTNIMVSVDEDINSEELTITLNNKFGSLKLTDETEYIKSNITRTVNLTSSDGVATLLVDVRAEDGTEVQYQITVKRKANLDLLSVTMNSETTPFNEERERYEHVVPNGNKPNVVITAVKATQTVQLLNKDGTVIASGVGTLSTTLTLSSGLLEDNYTIKVVSSKGDPTAAKEYPLNIRQRSVENGIMYIKVDGLGTIVDDTGLIYSATVAGKDKYPVEIKLKDGNAKVRIEDLNGNIIVANQTGTLLGDVEVLDGETKDFKAIVTSENGEEKEYTLKITRISSNLEIDSITVTDYDDTKENIITKNVLNYDKDTKTYKIKLTAGLTDTDISINALSSFTKITFDETVTAKGSVTANKTLPGLGTTKFKIELVAADR